MRSHHLTTLARPARRHDERGEISSWLIIMAGLCVAAMLGSGIMSATISRLAGDVGNGGASTPAAAGPASPDLEPREGEELTAPGEEPRPGDGSPPSASGPAPLASPSERADEVLDDIIDVLDEGDDFDVSNGDLNDIHDWLGTLTDDELAYVFANLSDNQIDVLFHNVHSSGFWSNDWDDGERDAFYETLRPLANSPQALLRLEEALGVETYLDVLVRINTDHSNGALPSAADSDALIREYIDADYLDGPIDDDKQAEGNLAIVDDYNFELAYKANGPADPDRWMLLNGFVDSEGRQWVRASIANPGTPVHEAIHNYSDHALNQLSNQFNEGVTEYFTLQVVANTDNPDTTADEAADTRDDRRNIYRPNRIFTEDLVSVVGEEAVAAAYFDGDVDGLRDAYLDATGRPVEDWDTMMDLVDRRPVSSDDWDDATDLLDPLDP